jgi:micrococcal nuclease
MLLGTAAPLQAESIPCVVERVVDGDTVRCRDGTRVRLIGIDSPEREQGPDWQRSRDALARLIPRGRSVRLELDLTATDRYGRTLAYIWIDRTLVNEAMVQGGWAVAYPVRPNLRYARRFSAAERTARSARSGLWEHQGFRCRPAAFRHGVCPAG